jgi:hypothetical protein
MIVLKKARILMQDGRGDVTVLLDEFRLVDQNRSQFVGVGAQLMRRLLVDHARRRAAKRLIPVKLVETAEAMAMGWVKSQLGAQETM